MTRVPPPDRSWIREMWAFLGNNDNSVIDPLWDVDTHLRDVALLGKTDVLVGELDDALATVQDGQIDWTELSLGGEGGSVEDGPDGLPDVLRGLRHRALTVAADPSRVPDFFSPAYDGVNPPRETWFRDEPTEVAVRERMWAQHEAAITAFGEGRTGWSSLHLYADLSDGPIGWARDLPPGGRRFGDVPADPYPVRSAVLVVDLDDDGVPRPIRAHPEIQLDVSIRDAFPGLCHFWGGGFYRTVSYPIWYAVFAMRSTQAPAFHQVRDELDRLLAEDPDDDRCRAVAAACGSYVLPQRARHWVDLLRWRFDGYDWSKTS